MEDNSPNPPSVAKQNPFWALGLVNAVAFAAVMIFTLESKKPPPWLIIAFALVVIPSSFLKSMASHFSVTTPLHASTSVPLLMNLSVLVLASVVVALSQQDIHPSWLALLSAVGVLSSIGSALQM